MIWLLISLLCIYALLLELSVQAELYHADSTQLRITLLWAMIRKTRRFVLLRTPRGHRLFTADESTLHPIQPGSQTRIMGQKMLHALRRADKARRFLLRHTHLDKLDALLLLHTGDAARSALLTGMLQGALSCIPAARRGNIRFRTLPEFFRSHTTFNAKCIIRLRLGTILLTAIMLLGAYLRGQHLTESEAG